MVYSRNLPNDTENTKTYFKITDVGQVKIRKICMMTILK